VCACDFPEWALRQECDRCTKERSTRDPSVGRWHAASHGWALAEMGDLLAVYRLKRQWQNGPTGLVD
jgi:hypothetical protein